MTPRAPNTITNLTQLQAVLAEIAPAHVRAEMESYYAELYLHTRQWPYTADIDRAVRLMTKDQGLARKALHTATEGVILG